MSEERYIVTETNYGDFTDTLTGENYCYAEGIDMLNHSVKKCERLEKLNIILEGFLLDKGYTFDDIIIFLHGKTGENLAAGEMQKQKEAES